MTRIINPSKENRASVAFPAETGGRTYTVLIIAVLIIAHLSVLIFGGFIMVMTLVNTPGATDNLSITTAFERVIQPGQSFPLLGIFSDPEVFVQSPTELDLMESDAPDPEDNYIEPIETAYSELVVPFLPYQTSGIFYNPSGCLLPSESENPIGAEAMGVSVRTYSMLLHAVELFNGSFDSMEFDIIRPSDGINGGIRLDVSNENGVIIVHMLGQNGFETHYGEVDPLVRALRVAGFAAWFWDWDEQFLGSEPVIYAIPIGEESLSEDFENLLSGPAGYFSGYRGIQDGQPLLDPHGGPIVCQWMIDEGMASENTVANLPHIGTPLGEWHTLLQDVAGNFITDTRKETNRLARDIGFLGGTVEDPSNMCGPLTAAILRDSGLMPSAIGPIRDPKSFWLANPALNGRPWSLFPLEDYNLFQFRTPLSTFVFEEWPLCTGDILFTYVGIGEYSHVFIVTEMDGDGRAFSVTNQIQPDGSFLVERVLLYDPTNPLAGAFRNEWTNDPERGRTGLGGFDVLRRIGSCLPPGTFIDYIVRAGDTLPVLAATYHSRVDAILTASGLPGSTTELIFGETIRIPVNMESGTN